MPFNTLQYSVVHCNTLQRTATHCTHNRIACNCRSDTPAMKSSGVIYTVQHYGNASKYQVCTALEQVQQGVSSHSSIIGQFPVQMLTHWISQKINNSHHPISRDKNSNGNFVPNLNLYRGTWVAVLAPEFLKGALPVKTFLGPISFLTMVSIKIVIWARDLWYTLFKLHRVVNRSVWKLTVVFMRKIRVFVKRICDWLMLLYFSIKNSLVALLETRFARECIRRIRDTRLIDVAFLPS